MTTYAMGPTDTIWDTNGVLYLLAYYVHTAQRLWKGTR